LRTVAKVATAGLYDMIWNLSKNFPLYVLFFHETHIPEAREGIMGRKYQRM
jgi:hypothetical protein